MFSTSGTAIATSVHPAPQYRLVCAGATDTGLQRSHNEDRLGVYPEVGLFIVADGMGGAAAGDVAARMAVELVCEAFVDVDVTWPRGTAASRSGLPLLLDAIQRANHCIHGAGLRARAYQGMGTTVAALLACGHRAALAHVGDSRVYRMRGGHLAQLTEDHSLFNECVRAGKADPDRPDAFEYKHVITRAVGIEPSVEIDARLVDAAPGDTFLLCSDGLCGVVPHEELAAILTTHVDLDEAVERLIARANELGGPDNVTAVLVRWEPANTPARACA